MTFRIQEIDPAQYDEWDAFVNSSPQGTIYHLSGWKRIVDEASLGEMRLLGCFEQQRLVGGCSFTEKVQMGYRAALNALTMQYAGFLLPACESTKVSDIFSREHAIISSFVRFLTEHYHQIHLFNAPRLKDMRPLISSRWKVSPCYTYIIDLGDEERLWSAMEGSVRRSVRKAEREGFEIRNGVDSRQMAEILERTFARQGLPGLLNESLVQAICSSTELYNRRFALSAWKGKENMVSAIVSFMDNHTAYYSLAATRSESLNTGVHSLLIWQLLKRLGGKVRRFDFLGANVPSIARFKEGFNPKLETYFSVEKWTSMMFRYIKTSAKKWRQIKMYFRI